MAEAALAQPAEAFDPEVQEALDICKGNALMALRITLIANALLESEIDRLKAEISTGYTRRKRN